MSKGAHQDILTNIRRILRSINLESKRVEKELGVSIPQLLCLNYLHSTPDYRSSSSAIADAMKLNRSTVSGIVKRLEAKGLVARLPNPRDRRGAYIALTASGAALLQDTPDLFHDKLERRLATLSEGQRDQVREGLETLVDLLEIGSVDASPLLTSDPSITPSAEDEI